MKKIYNTKQELLLVRRNRRRDTFGRTQEQYKNKFINKIPESCWIWLGCKWKNGYGYVRINRKIISAHRYIYSIYKGEMIV